MSLYRSIDVSENAKTTRKKEGFVGLYDDPTQVQHVVDDSIQASVSSIPTLVNDPSTNAVLQFAPSSRRKTILPVQRKLSTESRSMSSTDKTENVEVPSRNAGAGLHRDKSTKQVPRLDVINNFQDYADFVPESFSLDHGSKSKTESRKQSRKARATGIVSEPLSWEDDYEPSRPIDLEMFLVSEERRKARAEWMAYKLSNDLVKEKERVLVPVRDTAPNKASFNLGPPAKSKLNFAPALTPSVHIAYNIVPANPTTPDSSRTSNLPIPNTTYVQDMPNVNTESAEEAYRRRAGLEQPYVSHVFSNSASPPRQRLQLPKSPPSVKNNTTFDLTMPSKVSSYVADDVLSGQRKPIQQQLPVLQPPPPPPPIHPPARTEYSAASTVMNIPTVQPLSDNQEVVTSNHHQEDISNSVEKRGHAPGQKGFAQRYMAAQGWSKGQGLGSTGTGRLAPLFVKPLKDGKTGKIIDRHARSISGKTIANSMSRIVILEGMINVGETVDVDLVQDIGESCSNAYGKVERVKLVPELGRVLVKFTDTISALRCTSTVEGRIYAGRNISARYCSEEDFERDN